MEITTGTISIKSILKSKRKEFLFKNFDLIRDNTIVNVQKVLDCGSSNLGFASFKCDHCNETKHIHFTCKSRFCNSCSKPKSDLWMNGIISRWPQKLLYRHFIFTIPYELRGFFKRHRAALKVITFTAANSLLFFMKKRKLKPGILAVIHTFGAQLNRNPHAHLIVTNGAIHDSGVFKNNVYYPYKAIKHSWTVFLIKNLKYRCDSNLHGAKLRDEKILLNNLYNYHSKVSGQKLDRHCCFKPPVSFHTVVGYVGRYTNRPVIAQSRIIDFDGESVTFNYVDKRDKKTKCIQCSASDFIGLLVQHIPNKHFKMLHYYGIFANRCKAKYLRTINSFFGNPNKRLPIPVSFAQRLYFFTGTDPLACTCGGRFWKFKISIPGYPDKIYFDP